MARNKKHQPDQRADLRGGGFVGLPRVVYESAAYRAASPAAKVVLIEVLARFNGYNNGDINLDVRSATAALCRKNQVATGEAFAELMELGLIDLAHGAIWQQRKSRRWRLTFVSTGSPPNVRPATNDYLHWTEGERRISAKPKREAPRKYCATRGVAEPAPSATRGVADPNAGCYAGHSNGDGNEPKMPVHSATRGVAVISMPYGEAHFEPGETPRNGGGPLGNAVAPEMLDQLRERVREHLSAEGVGAQTRLAKAADMQGGTLSRFLSGKAGLNGTHFINLQLALGAGRKAA